MGKKMKQVGSGTEMEKGTENMGNKWKREDGK